MQRRGRGLTWRITYLGLLLVVLAGLDTPAFAQAPIINSVVPNNGPLAGGTSVTIIGSGFTGATAVNFGGTAAASFSVTSPSQIAAVSPPGSAGLVDVTVTTPSGTNATTTGDQFAYATSFPTGTLTGSVSPSTYSSAGQLLTFTFVFQNTGANPVRLLPSAGVEAGMDPNPLLSCFLAYVSTPLAAGQSVTCQNTYTTVASDLTTQRPLQENATVNATDTVTLGSQLFISMGPAVTFAAGSVPTVTAISPNTGSTSGGSGVTITGTGFTGATGVTIGGVAATNVTVVSATSITATTPAHAAGAVDVVVTTSGGSGTGTGLYTYAAAAPTIISINPVSGSTAGGANATIVGTNLSGVSSVTFGGVAATGVAQISPTSVTFFLPAHAAGAVDVVVTTPQGSASQPAFFTYVPPLTLTSTPSAATQVGAAYSQSNVAAYGTAPYSYALTSGALPAGVTLNTSTGLASGTPSATGAFSYTITVTDSAGLPMRAAQTVSGNIAAAAGPVATTTTVGSSVNPSAVGQSLTFTATVTSSGATPTGIVTFLDGATALGSATLSGGKATFSTSALTAGVHGITAAYGGDANSLTSVSGPLSQAVNLVSGTSTTLMSSVNPAEAGKPVTFTATVTSSGGIPSGTVTFTDGGNVIGSGLLAGGVASLTTASLTVGSHPIVARYGGAATFSSSNSAVLVEAVNTPADSLKLRALQVSVTKVVAQNSGSAIAGAIDTAITDGFAEGGGPVASNGSGLRFNFFAEPDQAQGAGATALNSSAGDQPVKSRVDDAFAAIDRTTMATKAPPLLRQPKEWMLWADVRTTGLDHWANVAVAPLYGSQVNALMGLTRRLTSTFLVGVFGGYETFDYRSDTLQGRLKGDGWTVGSYLGWKVAPNLRFDATSAYSRIGYDGSAGTASGSFGGDRWLLSTGLTGSYKVSVFDLEPSTAVYALWERENAYTDSLGTLQSERTFMTGRASGGMKVVYPWLYSGTVTLAPYAGLYGDYYFTADDAAAAQAAGVPLASMPLLEGWSARVTAGLAAKFASGVQISAGGELGGIGASTRIATFRGRASVPF